MIPLQSRLHNGATVSDWLGTAKTQAFVAAGLIEELREGRDISFVQIEELLDAALEEIRAVRAHVARAMNGVQV